MQKAQLILVADDEKLVELAKSSKIKFDPEIMKAISEGLVRGLLGSFFPKISFFREIMDGAFNQRVEESIKNDEQLILKSDLLKQIASELNVNSAFSCISPEEAKELKLRIGDVVENGYFYLQHPILTDVYIRPYEYEAVLAKEKEAAFKRLASTLGAKTITLKNAKFFDKKGNIISKLDTMSTMAINIGIDASFDEKGILLEETYAEYGIPRNKPYVPLELQEWARIDTDLRSMVQDRIEGHLLKSKVSLHLEDEISRNANIAAKIAEKGLDIGGKIAKTVKSTWFFEVEYYPLEIDLN
ncbi:hypothetical protein MMP65_19390 [Acinetobacter sp. ANC 3926]|uniref:hypothetical protein n=1 Tax=Acinetobacter genomosp. 15BJ TaxID=106651 RepID=UPI001F4B887F|nr:hypothetical protein [Acinetobacter genomosp. 15BJ]MCH7293599.1 hypothetical protein [Acinetobacter genomosp. 15BJ]